MKKFTMIASALTLPVVLTTAMLSSGLAKASVAPDTPIKVFVNVVKVEPCAVEEGWHRCVELADPKIKMFSTAGTSDSAVNAVANIYTEMMNRLLPTPTVADPKRKFDGFKVYITNNESWEVQSKLSGVGTMWPGKRGHILQGGASRDRLWITEMAIAKKNTRYDGRPPDPTYRTFDQVVHEMAHSIHFQLVDDQDLKQFTGGINPNESFAFRTQQWFGAPAGEIPPTEEALLEKVFSSRAAFSVEGYAVPSSGADAPATIFEHSDFKGKSQALLEGWNVSPLALGNNSASSVKVSKCFKVTLYDAEPMQNGQELVLTADNANLHNNNFNDIVSNVLVERVPDCGGSAVAPPAVPATIFEHFDFKGKSQDLVEGMNVGPLALGNDVASSVKVSKCFKVTLYGAGPGQNGPELVLTADNADLRKNNFDDIVSNVFVERVPNCGG